MNKPFVTKENRARVKLNWTMFACETLHLTVLISNLFLP